MGDSLAARATDLSFGHGLRVDEKRGKGEEQEDLTKTTGFWDEGIRNSDMIKAMNDLLIKHCLCTSHHFTV